MGSSIQLSPGVVTREIDLTNFVPNVGTSGGASVGQFSWGPVEEYTIIDNSNQLASVFGKATDANYVDWFSASNFLAYTSGLNIVRVVDETSVTPARNSTADSLGKLIKNEGQYFNVISAEGQTGIFAAKYPGAIGDSLKVSIADSASYATWPYRDQFDYAPGTSEFASALNANNDEVHVVVVDEDGKFAGVPGAVLEKYSFLSKSSDAKALDGAPMFYGNVLNKQSQYIWYLSAPMASDLAGNTVSSVTVTSGGTGYTVAPAVTFSAPAAGGVAATGVAVLGVNVGVDDDTVVAVTITSPGIGYTTAAPTITFTGTNTTPAAATVTTVDNPEDNWGQSCLSPTGTPRTFASIAGQFSKSLSGGHDGTKVTSQELIIGWEMFRNSEQVDVSLLFIGAGGGSTLEGGVKRCSTTVIQYVIDNVAEHRKDCVVFFSPDLEDIQNKIQSAALTDVLAKRTAIARSSSYAAMDSGWKLQYDVFNDKYRWIPLNADVAGLCAATDTSYDPWWSPGGFTRGKIKNAISLAFNPNKSARDELYKSNVNPIVTFTGEGTVLYGDKTLQSKASAFAWINVRRLFIVLEKAISRAAKYQLFEFNDSFTRAQFRAIVEPYLRDVKGRRGVYDFRVICDESNNTPEVIDRGEFVANIFIKPSRSINFITLNFVATRTGANFDEIVGSI